MPVRAAPTISHGRRIDLTRDPLNAGVTSPDLKRATPRKASRLEEAFL
jgi:hypothetical protein